MLGFENILFHFVYEFRYLALFLILSLGMIGLPIPDEFLMTFSGFQTTNGHMGFAATIFFSALGSFTGMNISYWIGRILGIPFLHRMAPYFHLNEKKIERAERWFSSYGNSLIVIGYFFPGFRHLTAYFSGMSKLNYLRYFSLAGLGALLWSLSFVTLGRLLGNHWHEITAILHRYSIYGGIALGIIIIILYRYSISKNRRNVKNN